MSIRTFIMNSGICCFVNPVVGAIKSVKRNTFRFHAIEPITLIKVHTMGNSFQVHARQVIRPLTL